MKDRKCQAWSEGVAAEPGAQNGRRLFSTVQRSNGVRGRGEEENGEEVEGEEENEEGEESGTVRGMERRWKRGGRREEEEEMRRRRRSRSWRVENEIEMNEL